MTFANVSVDQKQLTLLSQLLLTTCPGCVIHQSCDPMRTVRHLATRKIDAIFADEDTYPHLMHLLNRHKSKALVYLMCRQDALLPKETDGIQNIITYPVTQQKIQIALKSIPQGIREVV